MSKTKMQDAELAAARREREIWIEGKNVPPKDDPYWSETIRDTEEEEDE